MDIEVVAAFSSLVEAQIVCGALQASGIAARLMDQSFSCILPAAQIGGFRVGAPIGEAARARRVLQAMSSDASGS
ncbi:MAG TPA: hypothetical protein VIJ94_15105 [Caulobacteraceae bacterium]